MLSEAEEELVRNLRRIHAETPAVKRAANIATEIFATASSIGGLRIREHALAHDEMRVEDAIDLLHELFAEPVQELI
jgi:hypothetical protein